MAKSVGDLVLDNGLAYLKSNGTRLCVCSTQPTNATEAQTTYMLAIKTITSADFTGPVDDASGRKMTVNLQNGISVTNGGSAQHVAVVDNAGAALLYVTTCTAQTLTAGNTVNVPAWKVNFQDPT